LPHGPIAHSGFHLFLQRVWPNAGEGEEVLIHRVAKFVIPSFAGERGAGFVNDTGQHDIIAKTDAGAAWWTLGEIECVHK